MALRRFAYGVGSVLATALVFDCLSAYRAWFQSGCADCMEWAGVPFPFVGHGGFFTQTFVKWPAVRDDIIVIVIVALVWGGASMRLLRRN